MLRKIFHWGPLLALGIIKIVLWTCIQCFLQWLPFTESVLGFANGLVFFFLAFLIIYNFVTAIAVGPGYVPLKWRPKKAEDEQYLQYCTICDGFKAPRSHHCRKCNRCILKMDHHCPWINNCVGHLNHSYFILFLCSAVCGSIHACTLLIITVYKLLFSSHLYYSYSSTPPVRLSFTTFVLCIFCIGMSVGVFISLSFLLYIQTKSILFNRTGIEDWILEKADERRNLDTSLPPFTFPYDLGRYKNIKQVFYNGCTPKSDGINWDVRKGCSTYDLTIEQQKQKELKKLRKKPFKAVRHYSGAIFPLVNGFCTCLNPPCSMDSRMSLKTDDVILVTRRQKYWLFGEKSLVRCKHPCKGWFPRSCVVPITEYESYGSRTKNIKKKL